MSCPRERRYGGSMSSDSAATALVTTAAEGSTRKPGKTANGRDAAPALAPARLSTASATDEG
jgi:hypothetical protein